MQWLGTVEPLQPGQGILPVSMGTEQCLPLFRSSTLPVAMGRTLRELAVIGPDFIMKSAVFKLFPNYSTS